MDASMQLSTKCAHLDSSHKVWSEPTCQHVLHFLTTKCIKCLMCNKPCFLPQMHSSQLCKHQCSPTSQSDTLNTCAMQQSQNTMNTKTPATFSFSACCFGAATVSFVPHPIMLCELLFVFSKGLAEQGAANTHIQCHSAVHSCS